MGGCGRGMLDGTINIPGSEIYPIVQGVMTNIRQVGHHGKCLPLFVGG
jgi:hypothetical protein